MYPESLAFATGTATGAVDTSPAQDPRDRTAEDIARIVTGGYLSAVGGERLTDLLKGKAELGEVDAAAVQSALLGATVSAGTQAAFNEGRVDWTKVGLVGATGGLGGGLGGGSVRRRLDRDDLRLLVAAHGTLDTHRL